MKTIGLIALLLFSLTSSARDKDSTIVYSIPDSLKAVQFFAEIKIEYTPGQKIKAGGIQTDIVKLYLQSYQRNREFVFEFPKDASLLVNGLNINSKEKGKLSFQYNWKTGETYKLLISQATDSANNFSLYSGYAWLPREKKWKLIGTCRIMGTWSSIQNPSAFMARTSNEVPNVSFSQVWLQRNNGSWKNLNPDLLPNPVINLFGHVDSVAQRKLEISRIESAIRSGAVDVKENREGVYYKIIKQGKGNQVTVNDTVTAFYKVTLMNDTAVIDQAKDKPATFPLNRLIRGWQIGVPLLRVGGKIRLVIPSDLAYTIRTRSPKIPPNSILLFEIEVVDTKPPN